jgi:hypothetical protein
MQPDPYTHLWMYEQELARTMKQNALERAARNTDKPALKFGLSRIRDRITALRRVVTPASTGSA